MNTLREEYGFSTFLEINIGIMAPVVNAVMQDMMAHRRHENSVRINLLGAFFSNQNIK